MAAILQIIESLLLDNLMSYDTAYLSEVSHALIGNENAENAHKLFVAAGIKTLPHKCYCRYCWGRGSQLKFQVPRTRQGERRAIPAEWVRARHAAKLISSGSGIAEECSCPSVLGLRTGLDSRQVCAPIVRYNNY